MKKNINKQMNAKKFFKLEIFILGLVVFGFLLTKIMTVETLLYNEDNYFQLAHGQYLLEHGFPTIEPLRMHEGFHFLMPQWLFSSYITLLNLWFGGKGVVFFYALPLLFANSYFMIQITNRFTKKNGTSLLGIGFFIFMQFFLYSYLRPYLFTLFACLFSMYCFEKYIATKKKIFLLPIPILSVLEINIHNSLWPSLFLIQACYYGEWVVQKIRKEKNSIPFYVLLVVTILTFLGGLVNPYGLEYITYIIPSMQSIQPFQPYIRELQPLHQNTPILLLFVLLDGVALYYAYKKKIKIPYRLLFLFFGFTLMYLMSVRSGIFFYSFGQFFFVYILQFIKKFKFSHATIMNFLNCMMCIVVAISIAVPFQQHRNKKFYDAFDWLQKIEFGEVVDTPIFTTFDTGSYGTYKGYKVYIDTCAEIYGKPNNRKKDIAVEFVDTFTKGPQEEINKFFEKYQFAYCVVDSKPFADVIQKTGKYRMLYGELDDPIGGVKQNTGGWLFARE